jgi:DNA-binding FadR family transcriptional regulator
MRTLPDLKIERPRGTLADQVTDALVGLIGRGEYPAGSRLPSEMEMAERFGVSRTVVREAVSRLKSEGLAESHQGKGVFVRAASADVPFRIDRSSAESMRAVLEILELRRGVEMEAAGLAASRRTQAQLAEIRRAARELDRLPHASEDGADADAAFHRSIARATGNAHLVALWDFIGRFLRGAIRITRSFESRDAALVAQVRGEHETLVDAIARRDSGAAREAARHHLEMVEARIATAGRDFWAREGVRHAGDLAVQRGQHRKRTARRAR